MILILLFTVVFAYLFHQMYWRRRNLPPGPMPFPLIGNIPSIDPGALDKQFLKFKKEYGDVMTVWLPNPYIIISSFEKMKEIFIKNGDKVSQRPHFKLAEPLFEGNYGLIFNDNAFWRDQRRFALHVLRDFGIGRPILEQTIIEQASAVCEFFKNSKQKPMELTKILTTAIGNIIYQLAFGQTVDLYSDSNFIFDFRNNLVENAKFFCSPLGFLCELWLPFRNLDPLFGGIYTKTMTKHYEMLEFMKKHVKEHRETIDFEGEPRDYIDAFLMEQKKQNPIEGKPEWSDRQLTAAIYDLFGAGMETTSTSTRTFILHMIRNPEIQKKIHEEIDQKIGKDRTITMADQPKLPYFTACLQELQRISVILTLNLQRITSEDMTIEGYWIPKGTIICPQFPSVHTDEAIFTDPHNFDPKRHLDENGNFVKDERITPFSVGKRACLGEALARMELFLFSATFFQHFEFLPEIDGEIPEEVYEPGLVKAPMPFKVRAKER